MKNLLVNQYGGLNNLVLNEADFNNLTILDVLIDNDIYFSDKKCSIDLNTPLNNLFDLNDFIQLNLYPRLLGGKGGFGSQLRAAGGRMRSHKNQSNDACRDLSGRRISTLKEAQQVASYLENSEERERKQKQEELNRLEEKEKRLTNNNNNNKRRFDDEEFFENNKEMNDNVRSSVAKGLLAKKKKIKSVPSGENNGKGKDIDPSTSTSTNVSSATKPYTSTSTSTSTASTNTVVEAAT